jgi:hypothetical protein
LHRTFFSDSPIIQVISSEEEYDVDSLWGDIHYRSARDEGGLNKFIPIGRSTTTTWDFGKNLEEPDDEDVLSGAVLLWSSEAAMTAFNEDNDVDEDISREYDIAQRASVVSLETSGKTLADAKYVLVINGVMDTPLEEVGSLLNSEPAASEFGVSIGKVAGCISKLFLLDRKGGNVYGGCYLFETEVSFARQQVIGFHFANSAVCCCAQEAIDAYLASDIWATVCEETGWHDVKIQRFELDEE